MVSFRFNFKPYKYHRLGFGVPLLALIIEYPGMAAEDMEVGYIRGVPKQNFIRHSPG